MQQGDVVKTKKGAKYVGVCLAVYPNMRGDLRCSVEAFNPEFEGTIHVYPVDQMEVVHEGHFQLTYVRRFQKGE